MSYESPIKLITDLNYKLIEDQERNVVKYGIPHCSECKAINNSVFKNYRPNCGAKMDLDEVKK